MHETTYFVRRWNVDLPTRMDSFWFDSFHLLRVQNKRMKQIEDVMDWILLKRILQNRNALMTKTNASSKRRGFVSRSIETTRRKKDGRKSLRSVFERMEARRNAFRSLSLLVAIDATRPLHLLKEDILQRCKLSSNALERMRRLWKDPDGGLDVSAIQ